MMSMSSQPLFCCIFDNVIQCFFFWFNSLVATFLFFLWQYDRIFTDVEREMGKLQGSRKGNCTETMEVIFSTCSVKFFFGNIFILLVHKLIVTLLCGGCVFESLVSKTVTAFSSEQKNVLLESYSFGVWCWKKCYMVMVDSLYLLYTSLNGV
jgi:hypothetical protein